MSNEVTRDRVQTYEQEERVITELAGIKNAIAAGPFPAAVGSAIIPCYVNANGILVPSNASLGDERTPIYMDNGVLKVVSNFVPVMDNAGYHNSIYRGKYLGDHVTEDQWLAIHSGAFTDMYVGDYWVINGVTWRIAAFDYWYRCGDTECTTHHVAIVPDTNLASCQMNSTNVTTGAYIGSDYYTGNNSNTGKATAQTAINNAFGAAHILTHREYLQNAVTNGRQSAGAWYDSTFELMNEHMVYGGKVFEATSDGTNVPNVYTIDKSQLPLFALEPSRITNRAYWWLRSVVSATSFARVNGYGIACFAGASNSIGVRPAFAIKS